MNELKEKLMKLSYKEWTRLKRDIDIYHLEKERFEVKDDDKKKD